MTNYEHIKGNFVGDLFRKLAAVRDIASKTGKDTEALEAEVKRQIKQVSKVNEGDPITGEGVTKAGSGTKDKPNQDPKNVKKPGSG